MGAHHHHPEAVDPVLGLSPRAAAAWRQVHAQAVAAGYQADAEAMAWAWTVKAAAARVDVWERQAGEPEGHQATVKALEVVEGLIRRTLGIKASPPTYRGIVTDLGDLLVGWENNTARIPVRQAAEQLAALGANPPKDWRAKSTAIVDELERTITEDYGEAVGPAERQAYGRFLAAAYKLGKAETMTPMGWSVAFDLEDQDAIHGMTNSGMWWIGKAYGAQVPTGQILAVVDQVAIRGGLGREAAGEALEAALGSSFKRGPAYWRGLAATVATRSRTFGALSGLQAAGAVTYEYVNPLDERTSDVCRALDGVKFTIRGGIELRDRLLTAQDPEDWKAISPWPKPRDLVGPGGGLLSSAELQAKGIAWPPLHFHCRSSIDVDTWAPISAEDLGPEAMAAPDAPKPPRKARAPRAKPGKPPPPPVDPYVAAKARLDAATAELQARNLPTDRIGISLGLEGNAKARAMIGRTMPGAPTTPHVLDAIRLGKVNREAMTHRALSELVRDLEGRGRYLHDGTAIANAQVYADAHLAQEAREILELYNRRSLAYREAMELAPAAVRQAERRAQVGAMLQDLAKIKDPAQRAAVEAEVLEALAVYDEQALAIMRWDGVRIVHQPGESRAYAMPSWNLWESGHTHQDLTDLVRLDTTGPLGGPKRWIPARHGTDQAQRAPATVAHELGHIWDQEGSGLGITGARWEDRGDRPGLAAWWKDGIDAPFRGAMTRVKGKVVLTKLPGETAKHSKYMFSGRWVRDYEARIYNGAATKPDAAFLAETFRGNGGPVEFIAMAHQYVQEAGQGLRAAILESRAPGATESMARLFRRAVDSKYATGYFASPGSNLSKARGLYGIAYRDGLERSYRAGFRYVRDAGLTAADFQGDSQILGFAMTVRTTMGTPMADLVGPGGPLAGLLSSPANLQELEAIAVKLDKLDPDRAGELLWELTSRKPGPDFDLTDPEQVTIY